MLRTCLKVGHSAWFPFLGGVSSPLFPPVLFLEGSVSAYWRQPVVGYGGKRMGFGIRRMWI